MFSAQLIRLSLFVLCRLRRDAIRAVQVDAERADPESIDLSQRVNTSEKAFEENAILWLGEPLNADRVGIAKVGLAF